MKIKWFCALCWRHGELECDESAAHVQGVISHKLDVDRDMAAFKIPAGADPSSANAPWMDKYPAVFCAGDVHTGERRGKYAGMAGKQTAFDFS